MLKTMCKGLKTPMILSFQPEKCPILCEKRPDFQHFPPSFPQSVAQGQYTDCSGRVGCQGFFYAHNSQNSGIFSASLPHTKFSKQKGRTA